MLSLPSLPSPALRNRTEIRTSYDVVVAHPYPSRSAGPLLMLSPVTALPAGGFHPAKHSPAEVLRSDSTWAPVTVLAWYQLDERALRL
jgi:hypothetical protein